MKTKQVCQHLKYTVFCLVFLFSSSLPGQQQDRFRDERVHRKGKLWVGVTNFGQLGISRGGRGVIWPGSDIPGEEAQYINRGGILLGGIVPSDETVGTDLNEPGDLDTLVSEGPSVWSVVDFRELFAHFPDARSAIQVRTTIPGMDIDGDGTSDFSEQAVSEEDFISAYADTFLSADGFAFAPPKHQRSLGIEVVEKSYQFGAGFAEDIVFFDLKIRNIGQNFIRNLYVGFFGDNDMGIIGRLGDEGDAAGFMTVTSTGDSVNTAWVLEADGDEGGMAGVVGVRILRPATHDATLSFNWWTSDTQINSADDWGPVTPNIKNGDPNDRDPIGSPVNDVEKYILMTNGSIDPPQFDPVTLEFNPNIPAGATPNDASRFLISAGPLGTRDSTISDPGDPMFGEGVKIFAPGDSLFFTYAIIGGEGDPQTSKELNSFDPAAFEDLGRNSVIANSIFDTPGIDTDGDGFAGLDLDGDGIFDKGDGIPDFKGPQPPPSPPLVVTTADRLVKLDWSGADPNNPGYDPNDRSLPLNTTNPFLQDDPTTEMDERRTFEGFRVLRSRTGELGTFDLLAEFDLPHNKFGRNSGLLFTFEDPVSNGSVFYYAVVSFARGDPDTNLESLVSSPFDNLNRVLVSPQPSNQFAGQIYVEPNPYVEGRGFDNISPRSGGDGASVDFVNVPSQCTIRIFTLDGDLVQVLKHDDQNSSRVRWDLFNKGRRPVASGIYLFSVKTSNGDQHSGRFIVVR